jgi:catechol 2,3-dioxygenase-like lactoylglutathione lyase family enzyme
MDLDHLNLRVRDADACRDFYERYFEFTHAFDADGGHFVRNGDGFTLALIPVTAHQTLPDGFHIGFGFESSDAVHAMYRRLLADGIRVGPVQDFRPSEEYVTFRCWDPDGTEIEIYWEVV